MYRGDFRRGQTVRFTWNSYAAAGASITRATNGTISVYKDGGTTQSTTGITDTEDFDGLTGVHLCVIDTSADGTFYSAGSDFDVVLSAATIDGQVINATLASFSIQNRDRMVCSVGALTAGTSVSFTLPSGQRANVKVGDFIRVVGKGAKFIETYNSSTGVGTVRSNFTTAAAANDLYEVITMPDAEPIASVDYATDAISAAAVSAAAVTKIQAGLATTAAIGALPTNASIGAVVDTSLANAGVTVARMGSLDVNFTIAGSVLTVRNASGATLFTRTLATAARDALASAVPPP